MIKILVLSDIHMPDKLKKFPYSQINKYIKDINLIFGLGDYDTQEGLNCLYSFGKEVYAVSGNMDDYSVTFGLSDRLVVQIEDVAVGLMHGWGSHFGIREKITARFNDVSLICYGHTHSSYFGKQGNIYYFNPGSICGNNPSFGILEIKGKKIKSNIIKF